MRADFFNNFTSTFGEATTVIDSTEAQVEAYRGVLADGLLNIWAEEGYSGFAHGLVWFVNPADFRELLRIWITGSGIEQFDTFHVIARSAFGELVAMGERSGATFTVSCPRATIFAASSALMSTGKAETGLTAWLYFLRRSTFDLKNKGLQLFEAAREAHGALEPNEVYAFVPALIDGGSGGVETIERLPIDAHLTMLRTLAAPKVVPDS